MDFGFKDLKVYKLAYELAMKIFELSKSFSKEEKDKLQNKCAEVGKMLGSMINNPEKFNR